MDDSHNHIDERAVHARVQKRLAKRREFYEHLTSYIGVNVMLWSIWLFTGPDFDGLPWPVWVTFFWGMGMVGHAWDYYSKHGFLSERNEAMLQREIEREYARMYGEKRKNTEKRKNDDDNDDEPIGIGEDGELIYPSDTRKS